MESDSGKYVHEGLMSIYPESAVQAALSHCHEELFSRILETPLSEQELDLRTCLGSAGDHYWDVIENWREHRSFQEMCPEGLPGYLHDLFCSNMGALLAVLTQAKPN